MIDVSVTISPIRNRRGEATGASTVARDITEQRRAGDALAEAEERFRGAFEDAVIGMLMLTPQLRVLRANDAAGALLGRDTGELIGRSILEYTHPDDVSRCVVWKDLHPAGAADVPLLKRYVRPDGSIVEAAVTSVLVEPERGERYFFSQIRDVTEQRRAERQRAVIAELGHRALRSTDVIVLIGEAMRTVREVLGTANCVTTRRLASGEVRRSRRTARRWSSPSRPGSRRRAGSPCTSASR